MDKQRETASAPLLGRSRILGAAVRYAVPAALMGAGLGLWAYTDAWLTPAIERIQTGDSDPGELHIWVQEQRELAIVLAVVALVGAVLRRRAPVGIPALAVGVGLFIADCIVDAHSFSGWDTTVVMLVVGAALVGVASVSAWFGRRRPDPLLTRRVAAAVAIGAALLAPALGPNFEDIEDFGQIPAGLVPSGVVVMALLWCAALALACLARTAPLSARALAGYMAVPVVVLVGAGASVDGALPMLAAPVLALVVMSVIRGRGWVDRRGWVLLGVAAVVASGLYAFSSILLGEALGAPLMAAAGFEYPSDGVPIVPGALPIALGAGLVLAFLTVPQPTMQAQQEIPPAAE